MRRRTSCALAMLLILTACGKTDTGRPAAAQSRSSQPPGDAEMLGREVFDLVDRAIDYRGSHMGRPASSFRQMGIDSLSGATVRRLVNLEREPVVTVAFRKPGAHQILSCRGDSQILEEASLNGGRFTLMCTTASGAQRPVRVGDTPDR
ncbi:MAG TPA: hypothetical protein VHR41_20700 [Gemmatimonadales bacterium]|jgi:hypothetical protein|nr:hypothetical protein [Gemmatimonadales bacterium]